MKKNERNKLRSARKDQITLPQKNKKPPLTEPNQPTFSCEQRTKPNQAQKTNYPNLQKAYR
jgi:hypothetical protein